MVKKWTDDFGTVHYGTQAPREFRVGDEVETLDGRRGVVLSVACAGIYVVYVGFQDGVYEWYSRDGRAPLRHSADNPGNIRHRHPAAPETDVEAVIADVLAARSLGPIKAALAGTPPTSDANPAVPEGLRERIVAELLPGVRAILANPTYLAGAVNPPSTADLICDLAADRILALIAEQPAIVVMPLEWRHDPGNGEGLYLGGLYLGGVVPQDDERYYSASSDAACFYENFEDEDRARVELEKAVRAALKDAGR